MILNKNYKPLIAIGLILSLSLLFVSFSGPIVDNNDVAQIKDDDPNPDQVYYWFYVSVRIDDRTASYKINGTVGGLFSGYKEDFEKDLWLNLFQRKIVIGPFLEKNTALNAKRLYKTRKDKALNVIPVDTVPNTVYWFAITFYQSDRLGIFVMERSPAAVASGNEDFFINAFYEQLAYKQFAIGPFYDQLNAEEAKRMFRQNE
ncbi:MAG: hypothetical protein JXR68_00505 [Bacteroidales bacterium]|nr:hypothetical protein [Bacteroidales bacterium]